MFATDTAGMKVWEATYLPFGGVHVSTGGPIELRFPGQWFQTESGLHQNWMREYDPTTGQYIQADPLGLVDGASVYGYALQNPGRYVDPRGEAIWFAPIIIGAIIGAAIDITYQYYFDPNECDCIDLGDVGISAALGGAIGGVGRYAYYGYELKIGSNARIAPFGNRTGHRYGKWPHYHRRGKCPGQGIGRHRPWEKKAPDRSFWDRF